MPGDQQLREAPFEYYPRLREVRRYVLSHYSESLSLADVARVARMERTSFSAYFHRRTGVCFRDWLAAVRIARAKELLASEDVPIVRVASAVGFGTVRSFERSFLKATGQTAIAFKKSVRPS